MSTSTVHSSLRAVLCASLSIAALSVAAPASAADLDVKARVTRGETRLWTEAGVFWTGGDPIQVGDGDPFFGGKGGAVTVRPWLGINGAAGFDHHFAGTRWHINGEGRAGVSFGKDDSTSAFSLLDPGPDGIVFSANTQAKLTEWHWFADLGMGYDVFTGRAPLQLKFGLRIAEVASSNKVNTDASFTVFDTGVVDTTGTFNTSAKTERSFLGAGPRIGIEGEFPLWAGWTFDYKGDAAVLFGNTKITTDSTVSFNVVSAGGPNVSGTFPFSSHWSKSIYVWNFDMQAGFGYWITPNMKLTATYRVDAYLDALRQNPDDTLPAQSIDRYVHGPKIGVVGRWN